ncbi:glycoside hydrolase family 76 protein [Corynebacterium sphenisci]|uniref:glycoside hydrolase family 76 protein n=1 Tax=Corynebacterium sphenisci TaxID=191493 RepID=UPI000951C987|nr:glycoside hydrolase family 76 protein [Corynebacterium sphenisci]
MMGPTRAEAENWAYRADMAEQAIRDRHASRLWALPRTNLAVVSWPAPTRHKLFVNWNYWWQAHYLDCLVDAGRRLPSKEKARAVRDTIRGIRVRNLAPVAANRYYDDRAWLALALGRADALLGRRRPRRSAARLHRALLDGIDPDAGVLPWREGDVFLNVPANGPAAIAFARQGRLDEARSLVDWVFDTLIDDDGLVMDGIRLSAAGPETVRRIYTYNQGVMIGACLEIALALRGRGERERAARYLTRVHNLVHAVARHLATPGNVIAGGGGGDGGLFNGILIRYLALAATGLPDDDRMSRATRRICRRLVLCTAEAAWQHRLEVDGLPLFPADWTADASFPQGGGLVAASVGGAVHSSKVRERDLSTQLSGWMLMEAAAAVSAFSVRAEDPGDPPPSGEGGPDPAGGPAR